MNTEEACKLIRALTDATTDHTNYSAGVNQLKGSARREEKAMEKLFKALTGEKPTPEQAQASLGW